MKSGIIFMFVFFAFYFTHGQTEKEKKKIAEQILTLTKEYSHTWETLNMDAAANYHSDSTFKYYRYGTLAVSSNTEFKKMAPQWMEETKSLEIIEFSDPVVQVLSNNIAVLSFKGVAKIVLKNGKEELDAGTVTYVWQKINDKWKIVHIHESKK
jgi:ketosteroid isomerase-like protein